jgi:hypothetical protein
MQHLFLLLMDRNISDPVPTEHNNENHMLISNIFNEFLIQTRKQDVHTVYKRSAQLRLVTKVSSCQWELLLSEVPQATKRMISVQRPCISIEFRHNLGGTLFFIIYV